MKLKELEIEQDKATIAFLKAGIHAIHLGRNPKVSQGELESFRRLQSELHLDFADKRIRYLEAKLAIKK
jgi:hypothetical protein